MPNSLKSAVLLLTLSAPFGLAEGAALTHLGQKPDQHVVLISGYVQSGNGKCTQSASFKDRAFYRVFADGTQATEPFVVPPKRYLVITDLEWSAYGGSGGNDLSPFTAGNSLHMDLWLLNPDLGDLYQHVFSSAPLVLDANAATAILGGSEHMTSGILVGPSVNICPSASQRQRNFGATAYIDNVILHGYLIAKPGK